jgi:hypothetical protein
VRQREKVARPVTRGRDVLVTIAAGRQVVLNRYTDYQILTKTPRENKPRRWRMSFVGAGRYTDLYWDARPQAGSVVIPAEDIIAIVLVPRIESERHIAQIVSRFG